MQPKHIQWAKRIQALAQTGLEFAENPYDRERYEALRELAAEMMAESSSLSAGEFLDLFKRESGYATPKVDVRGAVFKDGKILLSRELEDGCWSLPGGWADVNDAPSQAVIREVREEAGYEVRCTKLAAVLDRDLHYHGGAYPFHIYKLLFLCEIVGEADELCHDITDSRFFDLNDLPPLSVRRTLPKHIELLFDHYQNPALPTVFD
ncbi:MAG: NUDIX hydrolase [Kiritimatiellales bacterium]|nr:NUDIX hydrolase [Kiritimatiellales bacterium]MCF7864681.1 NUDIX hydrolase [Kiritimatiellales bacterium]